MGDAQARLTPSVYDAIAGLYDPWSRSVTEDLHFYVEEARAAGGDVVELVVGTGRIAIPIAAAGVRVIGVDSSRGMLDVCADAAREAGVADLLDLRLGDLLDPPVTLEALSVVPDGPPIRFSFRGHAHRVARYWGPERIETGWWRGKSVRRDYYRIETEEGQRFWLFRRLEDGAWGMHGVFA